ncbi:MFS transporter [Sphingomonas sp. BGYR3]|uniref:MFS transporter n=1 Tax=Sphingomonas sp. BGYR3 TaxID=2975483 RepID=UPI0021A4F360|nr:MFS transporter [Sphingomonas sp. BGYR3]MDG5489507.1 MFS transporter [Sphingomonas sp. BGYR3]
MDAPAALPPRRRVSTRISALYGAGAVAYGVKDFCFSTFLLLFYNQVLGLSAAQVGLVIGGALIIDAFVDPAVGFLSDRTRSRWGRRHPWMYGAALPIGLGWLLLWNPPEWSAGALLGWLFVMAVLVRSAVSAYEVPSQALSPELTSDYDDRTRIMAYRYVFGWGGGLGMLILTYGVFLSGPEGVLDRAGYVGFSVAGAALIVGAILISALGTHREIARLPKPPIVRQSLAGYLREMGDSLNNRAFLILMAGGLFYFVAQGVSFGLSNYLYVHVWRMAGSDFTWLGLVLLAGAVAAFAVAPRLGRALGKPKAAMLMLIGAAVLNGTPYWLRLAGMFPEPGDAAMMPTLYLFYFINGACGVSSTILLASMLADVVEHSEARTGRRSEGLFFAGLFFIQKCTSGIGIALVGAILSGIAFPTGAAPGTVPVPVIDQLTIAFAAIYLGLGVTGALCYRAFPFGRKEHDDRIALLAQAMPPQG